MVIVANYTSRSSFTNCLSHLKGEKVFGFAKQPIDYLPGAKEDSHHPHHVNFSRAWVSVLVLNPILWRMYMFSNFHLVLVICYLCYFEVAWNWRNFFSWWLIMHWMLRTQTCNSIFWNSKKPRCSNAKQGSTFTNQ